MEREPQDHTALEQRISRALSGTAQYQAPEQLEALVLERIARSAVVPWWQRRVPEWPPLAQIMFALTGIGTAAALLLSRFWTHTFGSGIAAPAAALQQPAAALRVTLGVLSVFHRVADTVAGALPDAVWYGGIAACIAAYLALFFLIVFGYRLLQTPASR